MLSAERPRSKLTFRAAGPRLCTGTSYTWGSKAGIETRAGLGIVKRALGRKRRAKEENVTAEFTDRVPTIPQRAEAAGRCEQVLPALLTGFALRLGTAGCWWEGPGQRAVFLRWGPISPWWDLLGCLHQPRLGSGLEMQTPRPHSSCPESLSPNGAPQNPHWGHSDVLRESSHPGLLTCSSNDAKWL